MKDEGISWRDRKGREYNFEEIKSKIREIVKKHGTKKPYHNIQLIGGKRESGRVIHIPVNADNYKGSTLSFKTSLSLTSYYFKNSFLYDKTEGMTDPACSWYARCVANDMEPEERTEHRKTVMEKLDLLNQKLNKL